MNVCEQKKAPRPVPVARASMVWDDVSPGPQRADPAGGIRARPDQS